MKTQFYRYKECCYPQLNCAILFFYERLRKRQRSWFWNYFFKSISALVALLHCFSFDAIGPFSKWSGCLVHQSCWLCDLASSISTMRFYPQFKRILFGINELWIHSFVILSLREYSIMHRSTACLKISSKSFDKTFSTNCKSNVIMCTFPSLTTVLIWNFQLMNFLYDDDARNTYNYSFKYP